MKVIEKLRTMSTEEVADALYRMNESNEDFDKFCQEKLVMNEHDELKCPYNYDSCRKCIKEWLESEVADLLGCK